MSAVIDAWPLEVTLRLVRGDPFAFRLRLLDADGDPVDVSAYEWRATVTTGSLSLDFEYAADADSVRLWLRGDDTARLSIARPWPYDVTCRQPTAGEGVTVMRGEVLVASRVTEPLRHDPELAPGREEDLVPR